MIYRTKVLNLYHVGTIFPNASHPVIFTISSTFLTRIFDLALYVSLFGFPMRSVFVSILPFLISHLDFGVDETGI